jgi:hypothetical protein
VGSSQRQRPYLPDDDDLARGWPIGTGVVAGAWRHLVKARLQPAGMRWTTGGAQAVLALRAVRLHGPWEAYGPWHRHPPHQRVDGMSAPAPDMLEVQALTWAASSHHDPQIVVGLL